MEHILWDHMLLVELLKYLWGAYLLLQKLKSMHHIMFLIILEQKKGIKQFKLILMFQYILEKMNQVQVTV